MFAFATATGAERRGANMALFSSALLSGQTVGPAVGGALAALAGWRGAMVAAGGIGIAVAAGSAGPLPAAPRPGWRRARRQPGAQSPGGEPPADPAPTADRP